MWDQNTSSMKFLSTDILQDIFMVILVTQMKT